MGVRKMEVTLVALVLKMFPRKRKKKGSTKVKGKIFIRRENLCRN